MCFLALETEGGKACSPGNVGSLRKQREDTGTLAYGWKHLESVNDLHEFGSKLHLEASRKKERLA